MEADYYIREPSDEWEAFERWENEGGRFRQNVEASHVAGQSPFGANVNLSATLSPGDGSTA